MLNNKYLLDIFFKRESFWLLYLVQLSYNSDSSEATSTAVNRKSKKIRGTDSSNEANGDSIANGKGRNQSESNEETNDESSVATSSLTMKIICFLK